MVVVDVVDDDGPGVSHLVEDGVEEELPGGGPEVWIELETAKGEVFQGGRQGLGDVGRLVCTRDLEERGQLLQISGRGF